jgi:uncharacterized protein (DUF362 family)
MKISAALIRCGSYDYNEVKKSLQRGIDLLGGVEKYGSPGDRLVLKANLLAEDASEKCVTTHPSVFKGTAEIFLAARTVLKYGDSPGFGSPAAAARKAGIPAAGMLGIKMADFTKGLIMTNV